MKSKHIYRLFKISIIPYIFFITILSLFKDKFEECYPYFFIIAIIFYIAPFVVILCKWKYGSEKRIKKIEEAKEKIEEAKKEIIKDTKVNLILRIGIIIETIKPPK